MKKLFSFICLLLCAAFLSSCAGKTADMEHEEDSGSQQITELKKYQIFQFLRLM